MIKYHNVEKNDHAVNSLARSTIYVVLQVYGVTNYLVRNKELLITHWDDVQHDSPTHQYYLLKSIHML